MRRRILIFGLVAVAAVGTAHAQQTGKVPRIAVVHPSHPVATLTETSFSPGIRAIFTELRRLGYVEGKNILIERYSGEGRAAHYTDLARNVARSNPDLIITIGNDLVLLKQPLPRYDLTRRRDEPTRRSASSSASASPPPDPGKKLTRETLVRVGIMWGQTFRLPKMPE
jgi:putative ABC transport system substrate-binding protein